MSTVLPSAPHLPPAAPPPQVTPHTACKTILAATIATFLLSEVRESLATLKETPHLVGILANNDPAAKLYAEWTRKTCEANSIKYTLLLTPPSSVEETILTHNTLPTTHGILVYYPIHSTAQDTYLANLVSPSKDVEGLSHLYLSNMYTNTRYLDPPTNLKKSILPCTPLALIKVLEFLHLYSPHLPPGNRLFGHTILILNRSEVVGRPLAALLANDGATVYSADVSGLQQFTRGQGIRKQRHEVLELPGVKMEEVVPHCDVVITGVPGEGFKFPCGLLREGAVCVNFSTEKGSLTRFETAQNFGPEVKERASIFVPAIGKVTIVILLRNLLRLVQNNEGS